MGRVENHEETVKRLYPELLKLVEGVDMADAGVALCTALTVRAWREDYCLDSLLYLTRGSIINDWRNLEWGTHDASPDAQLVNGEDKDDQT